MENSFTSKKKMENKTPILPSGKGFSAFFSQVDVPTGLKISELHTKKSTKRLFSVDVENPLFFFICFLFGLQCYPLKILSIVAKSYLFINRIYIKRIPRYDFMFKNIFIMYFFSLLLTSFPIGG